MDSLSLFDGKVCKKCGECKPRTSFATNKQCVGGRRPTCRVCSRNPETLRAAKARYHQRHAKEIIAKVRRWTEENREYARNRQRIYRQSVIAKDPEAFRQKRREQARTLRQRDPARARASAVCKEAKRKKAPGKWTGRQWTALLNHYGHQCMRCSSAEDLTADHVVPIAKGGSNTIDNIQCLCRSCNSKKHLNTVDHRPDQGEWARSLL